MQPQTLAGTHLHLSVWLWLDMPLLLRICSSCVRNVRAQVFPTPATHGHPQTRFRDQWYQQG